MSEHQLVPHIRFQGFEDEWEQRKLREVAEFINGRAYKQSELLDAGKYKVLRVGNFYTNDDWYYSDLELDDKYYVNDGDLLYTWSATFGPHIWHGERVIYHYHIWKIILFNTLNKLFAIQFLERDKANILSHPNGSTMIHITKADMENKDIFIPSVEEQKQIGSFFKQLDNLITLQQQKLNQLDLLKKALLQNLFPAQGAKIPELRFKGFEDEWKVEKVDDIAKLYQPKTISRNQMTKTGYPVFGANGFIGNYDKKNHSTDQVTISARGENTGVVSYVSAPVWITGNSMVVNIDNNKSIDKFFLYSNLSLVNLKKYVTGGAQPQLTKDILKKVEILITLLSEQQKISAFLSQLDHLIELEQQKLAKIKQVKKALLQNMFVE
ncbi:restriction endonuclease subunit S [Lactobacillus bombicola]|uniref:Restriction endonuclease subunit S n=1 Tax=Lactobacillus bombicola TaxID=1505723 RepID=A0A396SS70_9LACO|nr:restriction endonuclease subunit S [Lactobacillus bombicola]RHW54838.1 restriction endonuclease subunit S [Lactobacillus bombicola]